MRIRTIAVLILLFFGHMAYGEETGINPIEVGDVQWGRDFDAALKNSAISRKPVLVLLQEVPGCAGVQKFGREVLTNPLLVEAIEDEFIPVLIYNNRNDGMDRKVLNLLQEPAFNFQVIRFLDAKGLDIIARKDRIWTTDGVASRMIEALKSANRPVPKYLETIAEENNSANHSTAAFTVHCFWACESELGRIDGVIYTEAGWINGREVNLIVYNEDLISLDGLIGKAAKIECAQKIYTDSDETISLKEIPNEKFDAAKYSKAKKSDQKKQIQDWGAIYKIPALNSMQLTKINAFAPIDRGKALEWLSQRQFKTLIKLEKNND